MTAKITKQNLLKNPMETSYYRGIPGNDTRPRTEVENAFATLSEEDIKQAAHIAMTEYFKNLSEHEWLKLLNNYCPQFLQRKST